MMSSKKIVRYFFIMSIFVLLIGCKKADEEKEQVYYIVVKMSDGKGVKELFDFESVSKISLDTELAPNLDVDDGVYCIGELESGKSVVWRSDDDGYGYDDCLFVYVEDKVSDVQVTRYASKLKETPISYEDFKEKINNAQ